MLNPRPVQSPRPPLMLAAMGPVMLKRAARYADIWNSISFLEEFDAQLAETRERAGPDRRELRRDRPRPGDPRPLVHDVRRVRAQARRCGIACYESEDAFTEMVGRVLELGITEIGLYWPTRPEQRPMFERIATGVIPKLKADHVPRRVGSQ